MPGKFIDLSLELSEKTPVFPGDPAPIIKQVFSIQPNGSSLHFYSFGGHSSTHIDAPAHFMEKGQKLSEISLENFCGEGIVVHSQNLNVIDIDILDNIKVSKDQIVFFRTDYISNIDKEDYFSAYPVISERLAGRLTELKVKMIGIDSPSPDRDPWPVHKILLPKNILIIENLCNLDKLPERFKVYAFPIKVKTDGVPVRVVAEI